MTCFTGGKYEKEDDCRPAGECTDAYGAVRLRTEHRRGKRCTEE